MKDSSNIATSSKSGNYFRDASTSFASSSFASVAPFAASSPLAPKPESDAPRKRLVPKEGWLDAAWQVIESQRWDELSKQWIITTLSAPADIITDDLLEKLHLSPAAAPAAMPAGSGPKQP